MSDLDITVSHLPPSEEDEGGWSKAPRERTAAWWGASATEVRFGRNLLCERSLSCGYLGVRLMAYEVCHKD